LDQIQLAIAFCHVRRVGDVLGSTSNGILFSSLNPFLLIKFALLSTQTTAVVIGTPLHADQPDHDCGVSHQRAF
jgi:hypothetical protein